MRQVMVRYKVKPDRAAENEALVRAVYEELRDSAPEGLRYATYVLADGVSFVHLATVEEGAGEVLPGLAAFQRFQDGIADRCDDPPHVAELREIGAYRR